MLQLSNSLLNKPVISLRTGAAVATITAPLINPNNLKVEGFYCIDRYDKSKLILLYQDIREVVEKGFLIDDHDVLAEPQDLIRLKKIMDLKYSLIGKHVVTVDKEKVGKVSDYAVEMTSMYVQKLYVAQSVFKSLTGGSLSVDRSQVNEITPKRIIINELSNKAPATAPATA